MNCLLGIFVEDRELGVLHRETVAVRLNVRDTFLPDLAYFTKAQVARLPITHAPFAPVFVLEATSPLTVANDTGRKFTAYELHQVQEYWILDPQNQEHRFYRRTGDMLDEFGVGDEVIHSTSIPGFWVKRAWLHAANLPKVSDCLKQVMEKRMD